MLKKTTSNYIKLFNITITTCAIIVSSLFFCKEIKAEQNYACEYETVTNAYTGESYCMPKYIYESQFSENPNSNYADDYRRMVRTGNIGEDDIRILEQYAEYNYFRDQFYKNGIQGDFDSFWNNELNRLSTYWEGVRTGTWWRNNMSMLKLALGWNSSSMPNNTSSYQAELQSLQSSSSKNYYTGSQNNVYNYGDTNYYSFYNPTTNNFYYQNNYYEINNYYYNYNTYNYHYTVNNSTYFNVTYNIDNTVINMVSDGVTTESTHYFMLPDGRNSYNLTLDQLNGLKTDLNISSYTNYNLNSDLIGLYHFDGNKYNSAFNNNFNSNIELESNNINVLNYVGLPSEYQQVEYIQSTGVQYINPNIILNEGFKFNISCDVQSNNNWLSLIGIENENNTFRIGFTDLNELAFDFGIRDYRKTFDISSFNGNITFSIFENLTNIYLNDKLEYTGLNETVSNYNDSVYIFALNNKYPQVMSANQFINAKLYYLSYYDQYNNLKSYLIPCYRKSDNVIGLYDLINNEFYINSGTGVFLKGKNIYPTSYYDNNDSLLTIYPNTITYLTNNNNFSNYLYLGSGTKNITIDFTSEGNTIDFRFYPVENRNFTLSLGDIDISVFEGNIVNYNQSLTNDYVYISYSMQSTVTTPPTGTCKSINDKTGTLVQSDFYSIGNGKYQINYTCKYPKTATTNIPSNESFLVKNNLADYINFGEWNHIAILKNGDLFINGKYINNYPSMISDNILNIKLDSSYYSYLDEIRISKSLKYNKNNFINGLCFNPPSLPYDDNVGYLLPETAESGQLLIQSIIPVDDWQIGGIRTASPTIGDVYVNVTDIGLLNSIQQYDGTDWISVKGAIYNPILKLWVSYFGYSIYTNNWSYNDLTEMNPSDIKSDSDYFGWLGAWFTKINTSINNIKLNVVGFFNNEGDDITNEFIENNNVDITNELNVNITNLKNNKNIIMQQTDRNPDPIQQTRFRKLGILAEETLGIYFANGLGWILFLVLIMLIVGVIL